MQALLYDWCMETRPLSWLERVRIGIHRWLDERQPWPLPVKQTDSRLWRTSHQTAAEAVWPTRGLQHAQ